jgi:ethanolamine utilization protein EutQ (cupin superfamily)
LWLWSIAPGVTYQATGEKAEEYALLLEGELELRFSDRLLTVLPGNAIALPLQQAYSLTAKGSVAARFVLMFVPA